MNIIVPMAGLGKRLRPHTLTTPKPLLPIAGKPIVQRLVEDIAEVINEPIETLAFVVGNFGQEVENQLIEIAQSVGATGKIFYQHEALGTAHAILCAKEALSGKVVVAYADTLFRAGFKLNDAHQGTIWVSHVDNPEQFGVVKLNSEGSIEGFYEKPKHFVSDQAIIGIYYFADGELLEKELQYLLDQKITTGGEYGITDALQNMMKKGIEFHTETVAEWLDCGNKEAILETNRRILELLGDETSLISQQADVDDALIIEPCFIAPGAHITNSVIGPYVSVGAGTTIQNSVVRNTVVQNKSWIENTLAENSLLGNFTSVKGKFVELNLGDFNQFQS